MHAESLRVVCESEDVIHNKPSYLDCLLTTKPVVPNLGSMDPQGYTQGFWGVHGLYMHKMKAK